MINGSRRKPRLHRKCFSECRILQPRTKSAVLMKRPKPSAKPNGSKNSVKKPKLNRPPGKTPWLWVMMKS